MGLKVVAESTKTVLLRADNRFVFLGTSVGFFVLLFMVPVWTTPGNDIAFHFSLLPVSVLLLMVLLSVGNGLVIAMQYHIHQQMKLKRSLARGAKESVTFVGMFSTALVSTMACAACYSSLLSVLGLGVTTVLVEQRIFIAIFSLALTAFALYYSSKRIENKCQVCTT